MEKLKFECVTIKVEANEEEEDNESFEADGNLKCGSIFLSNRESYLFICEFCKNLFESMEAFGIHMKLEHFNCEFQEGSAVTKEVLKQDDDSLETTAEATLLLEIKDMKAEDDSPLLDSFTEDSNEKTKENRRCISPPSQTPSEQGDENKLYCDICDRSFKTKSSYTQHNTWHRIYGATRVRITKRPTTYQDGAAQSKVGRKAKESKFYCDLCDRHYAVEYAFRAHAEMAHGDHVPLALQSDVNYLQCKFCDRQFDRVTERIAHEGTHDIVKPYICKLCGKTFRHKFLLNVHYNSHEGLHPFQCPQCPKAFTTRINLNSHIKLHMGIRPHGCQYCDKKFATKKDCIRHERVHTNEKPFQCEDCGLQFRAIGILGEHKKRHTNIKTFRCNDCGKMFLTKPLLKDHRISHTDERPFECTECGKTFQRSKALIAHKQLHSDVKRYECTICGKRFAQCAGLHSHRKTHIHS